MHVDTARSVIAPYQAKLLTWENVFGGRDCTGQYNAQIELCGDGNFITRSNNVERVYRRVLPCDLDNDGLPNTIDPAPETPRPTPRRSPQWAVMPRGLPLVVLIPTGGLCRSALRSMKGARGLRCLTSAAFR